MNRHPDPPLRWGMAGRQASVERYVCNYRTGARETSTVTTPAQTSASEAQAPTTVLLTDVAAQKVKTLIEQEGRDDLRLRVAVQPGGCSGLRYQLFFDERSLDGDLVSDYDGVEVVVDRMSAPYLTGATIDFADRIDAQGFTIDNPNAGGSCACGDSFH
jgi:iron-sulfur cluster assembly accessory protein